MLLEYVGEQAREGPYGRVDTHIVSLSLDAFMHRTIDDKRWNYLSIMTKVGDDLWVPVLDIDNEDKIPIIEERLADFSFVRVNSSPNKYWFIIDHLLDLKRCLQLMASFDDLADKRHRDVCEKEKRIVIRGHIRDLFKPRIIISKDMVYSSIFKEYIQALHDHFNSKAVAFYAIIHHFRNKPEKELKVADLFQEEGVPLQWGDKKIEKWDSF